MVGELGGAERRAAALARGSHIDERQTTLPAAELLALGTIEQRNAVYIAEAPALCLSAARKALGERPASHVSFVATSSCTGYHLPGLSAQVSLALGFESSVGRLPITEAGCAGGVVAMTATADHLRARYWLWAGCGGRIMLSRVSPRGRRQHAHGEPHFR